MGRGVRTTRPKIHSRAGFFTGFVAVAAAIASHSGALFFTAYATSLGAACHAVLNKRDSRSAWGWIGICWILPFSR
jgi:hypothetical protein